MSHGPAETFLGLPDARLKEILQASARTGERSPHHLTRFSMYRALSGLLASEDAPAKRCLSVSQSGELARVLGLRSAEIVDIGYPEHSLLALRFPDAAFDFCVSDQVLEHVEGSPFEAVNESIRVLRPGGTVVHTTCFINPVHHWPGDFWRFTPEALALMCRAASGLVVGTGAWGNRQALALVQIGLNRLKIPLDEAHPLHAIAVENDPKWPIVTWVVARKPA